MRIKRKKHCDKYLSFYRNKFKIHAPYQIILDLTFCQAALQNRVQIKEQLNSYLDGEYKLFNSKCILAEGRALGPKLHGAMTICEKFEERKCEHEKDMPASACLANLVKNGNEHGLFIATQDPELRDTLRGMKGVPLLHVNHNVIVLEKPSNASLNASDKQDSKRLISEHERDMLKQLKGKGGTFVKHSRKRKGPKGPNPLSVRKKKHAGDDKVNKMDDGKIKKKTRKRSKKKIE